MDCQKGSYISLTKSIRLFLIIHMWNSNVLLPIWIDQFFQPTFSQKNDGRLLFGSANAETNGVFPKSGCLSDEACPVNRQIYITQLPHGLSLSLASCVPSQSGHWHRKAEQAVRSSQSCWPSPQTVTLHPRLLSSASRRSGNCWTFSRWSLFSR